MTSFKNLKKTYRPQTFKWYCRLNH